MKSKYRFMYNNAVASKYCIVFGFSMFENCLLFTLPRLLNRESCLKLDATKTALALLFLIHTAARKHSKQNSPT